MHWKNAKVWVRHSAVTLCVCLFSWAKNVSYHHIQYVRYVHSYLYRDFPTLPSVFRFTADHVMRWQIPSGTNFLALATCLPEESQPTCSHSAQNFLVGKGTETTVGRASSKDIKSRRPSLAHVWHSWAGCMMEVMNATLPLRLSCHLELTNVSWLVTSRPDYSNFYVTFEN